MERTGSPEGEGMDTQWWTIATGALAGCIASTGQAAVGKSLEKLILPRHEDADIAPRMAKAIGRRFGRTPSPAEKWVAGTLFHYAYGAGWGVAYAYESLRPRPTG
jgi:hypothetical protein